MTPLESSKQRFPGGISIIGTGRLGSSLALRLHSKGYTIKSLYSRNPESCERIADKVNAGICNTFPLKRSDLGDLVFLCLPDNQISRFAYDVAQQIYGEQNPGENNPDKRKGAGGNGNYLHPAWIHTSGALPAEVLKPLSDKGAGTASFHPIQTFTSGNQESAFEQCFVTLQGNAGLCADLKLLVRAIGARPLPVDRDQKSAVHLGAVFVCNFMAPLFDASQQVLTASGNNVRAREIFRPLVEQTVKGLLENPPEEVLTGPVMRGDTKTIEKHIELLACNPEALCLYRELGQAALRVAKRIDGRDDSRDGQLQSWLSEEE